MNKKILSLVLALVMVLGTFTTVFAEEAKTEKVEKVVGKDNKIQYVIDKKFVEGYGDGDYGYDKNIKRSEITKLLVFANGNKELSEKLQGSMQLYSDVNAEYWANGVISVGSTVASKANKLPMLNGYPDGSFKPENDVTYAELAKMLVVLVKEDLTADMAKEANKNWATQWMTWATQLGILDDVDVTNSNAPAKRADAFTMLYNALYKMVEFKRIPANDKVGVLSSLRNDKLVLNQDAEKQTYTITKDTVFVLTDKTNRNSNTVKVSQINNPDFYLGSLVRIMVNDKNEVSHILELGNPAVMAKGSDYIVSKGAKNTVWEGVADYTISTGVTNINSLKDVSDRRGYYEKGYVTLTLKSNETKVDTINFMNKNRTLDKALTVNSDTKVYVANPANNQMREVKDIYEALSLIGFRSYTAGYAIPNVYAGFNTDGYKATLKGYDNGKVTAKVIVFNVVTKDQGGEKLRVVNQANYPGNATLENAKGELKDQSFIKNIAKFPYNYGDLYDVIELKWAGYNNNFDNITTVIDHSATDKFPVVRVKDLLDNDTILVEDRFQNQAPIYVGNAEIFNAKQYKDLKVGDFLQYLTVKDTKNNEIDVLSILPRNNKDVVAKFERSHSIEGTLNAVQGNIANGIVQEVNNTAYPYTATIKVQYSNWDKVGAGIKTFEVDKANADLLALNIDHNVKFLLNDKNYGLNGMYFAFNFKTNETKELVKPSTVTPEQDPVKVYKAEANKLKAMLPVTEENATKVEEQLKKVKDLYENSLNSDQQKTLANNDLLKSAVGTGKIDDTQITADVATKKADATQRAALKAKIAEAEKALEGVTASNAAAADVEKDKKVAPEAEILTFKAAIATAKAKFEGKNAVVAQDTTDLDNAIKAFKAKIVTGTKEAK